MSVSERRSATAAVPMLPVRIPVRIPTVTAGEHQEFGLILEEPETAVRAMPARETTRFAGRRRTTGITAPPLSPPGPTGGVARTARFRA